MSSSLREKIRARLAGGRRMSFAEFMEMALYDSEGGYYTTCESPIGFGGDYYTSGDVDPIFGKLLARQFREMSDRLGGGPFTLVEAGPGKGTLCRDILIGCLKEDAGFASRLSVILVEKSPRMIASQREILKPLIDQGARIRWAEDIGRFDAPIVGCVFSNELLDAFPVHRIRMTPEGLREIYVRSDGDGLTEEPDSPSTEALARHLSRLKITLPADYVTEVGLQALEWTRTAASALGRGFFLAIDYGYVAEEYYHAGRKTGTLLCYCGHKLSENPYERIGEQDITAHVDFTSIALAGREAGLEVAGFTDQMSFLLSLGISEEMERIAMEPGFEPEHPKFLAMKQLMSPAGFGKRLKVIILHKGVDAAGLRGLAFRPFVPMAFPE